MTKKTKQLGNKGEDLACEYLQKNYYQIIGRNVRLKYGEIDIIAAKSDDIILVEVKTKQNFDQGLPEEMVNITKQNKLRLLARALAQKYDEKNIRIDVIAIDFSKNKPKINHIINAII